MLYHPTSKLSNGSHPFGSVMNGRSWSNENYRFGFNGKELDPEGMGGGGSTYDYGFRIYNAQLGKFLSVDPLSMSYPWYTPYQFAGNMPIWAIDLDGLEELKSNNGIETMGMEFQDELFEFRAKVFTFKTTKGNTIDLIVPTHTIDYITKKVKSDNQPFGCNVQYEYKTFKILTPLTNSKSDKELKTNCFGFAFGFYGMFDNLAQITNLLNDNYSKTSSPQRGDVGLCKDPSLNYYTHAIKCVGTNEKGEKLFSYSWKSQVIEENVTWDKIEESADNYDFYTGSHYKNNATGKVEFFKSEETQKWTKEKNNQYSFVKAGIQVEDFDWYTPKKSPDDSTK
jgi:RHS repeat-associated protein